MQNMKIQRRLKQLGFYSGKIDGIIGPKSEAAIIAFKRSVGLRARAYVGPITLKALFPEQKWEEKTGLPWMDAALAVKGLHEVRDVSRLKTWFDKSVSWIDPREIPWCGAFVATCVRIADPKVEIPENPLGARAWGSFGEACEPRYGAVMTFWRGSRNGWQGHVGFYVGEDASYYHILGGNQSNAVTITKVRKDRFLKARWMPGFELSSSSSDYNVAELRVTENEA